MVECLCSHQDRASGVGRRKQHAYMLGACVVSGPHLLHFTQVEVSDQTAGVFSSSYLSGSPLC